MFLSKSKHGIYYLWYKDENNRRQKVFTKARRKSDALKFLQNFKVEDAKRKAPCFSQNSWINSSNIRDQILERGPLIYMIES